MTEVTVNSRMLGLKDINVHVDDYGGTGRTVILIHGWPLSGESWSKQVNVFKDAGFRVLAYDRRGFGRSDKPSSGYDYDTLAEDLNGLITELDLTDVTVVGFSMGGGEAARYIGKYGEDKLHSVVFASAVPPMMLKTDGNPDGPLNQSKADEMSASLEADSDAFYDQFTKEFFSANADGNILVTEQERQDALALCMQADTDAALAAMKSFAMTDFRDDLAKVTVPTLVIHGDADGTVPYVGSGQRIHESIPHSELHVVKGGPHGINVSHTDEFNGALLAFLSK